MAQPKVAAELSLFSSQLEDLVKTGKQLRRIPRDHADFRWTELARHRAYRLTFAQLYKKLKETSKRLLALAALKDDPELQALLDMAESIYADIETYGDEMERRMVEHKKTLFLGWLIVLKGHTQWRIQKKV